MATTQKLLIVGTHAQVGKTVVGAIIAQALGATYWKPIHCGSFSDSDFIRNNTSCRVFDEVFISEKSVLPNVALRLEGKTLKTPFKVPNVKPLVIEGLGGVMQPIDDAGQTILDAIHPMEVDVIVVAKHNNQTVNDVLLICHNLQWLGFNILGIVYNGEEDKENENMIEKMSGIRNKYHLSNIDSIDQHSVNNEVVKIKKEIEKWIK